MAVKPPPLPPLGDVVEQVNKMVGPAGLAQEIDRNARQLAQAALRNLDFVSREEFDAQCAVVQRLQKKVATLESELAAMEDLITQLENRSQSRQTKT
ncbi:MAG: accessory factor UbiK family protein [Pseudomonadota bacterium]